MTDIHNMANTVPNVNGFNGTGIDWVIGSQEFIPGSVPLDDDDDDQPFNTFEDAVFVVCDWAGEIDYDLLDVDEVNRAIEFCAGKTPVPLPPPMTGDQDVDDAAWDTWDTAHGAAWQEYGAACLDVIHQRGKSQLGADQPATGEPYKPLTRAEIDALGEYKLPSLFDVLNADESVASVIYKAPDGDHTVFERANVEDNDAWRAAINDFLIGGNAWRATLKNLAVKPATVQVDRSFVLAQRMPFDPGTYQPDAGLRLFLEHIFYAADGLIEKCWCRIMDDGSIKTYNYKQLDEAVANFHVALVTVDGRSKKSKIDPSNLLKFYKNHSQRRNVKVVFEPGAITGPGAHNLWLGFPHNRDTGRRLMVPFLKHVFYNVANGRKDVFKYTIRWLAHAVQKPNEAMPVALILYGKEMGSGKSTVGRILNKLLGAHGCEADLQDLVGNFNIHTLTWSFMFLDDAYLTRDDETMLRKMLTKKKRRIEIKGGDVTQIPNCLHIMLTSNHEPPVPVAETDRRYAAFRVGAKKMKNRPYFDKIEDDLSAGGYNQLLDFLMQVDLTKWNPENIPLTKERAKLQDMSADDVTQWLMDRIADATYVLSSNPSTLKTDFYTWHDVCGQSKRPGSQTVGERLRDIFGDEKVVKDKSGKSVRVYDVSNAEAKLDKWRGRIKT
jgi:hypothetical protein